jgi:anti-sigma factor ChrR (cupin superfamily)
LQVERIDNFIAGWFIGNFEPTIYQTKDFEVAIKYFSKGDTEPSHKQIIATEITGVINGVISINNQEFQKGDLIRILPGEYADFKCLEDCSLVCVKFPSDPSDKILRNE